MRTHVFLALLAALILLAGLRAPIDGAVTAMAIQKERRLHGLE